MNESNANQSELSHLDEQGRARMVDIGEKPVTHRVCVARCEVTMEPATLSLITSGKIPKGDVFATARIAGIQAAKRTDEWIPLAHPLPLDSVEITMLSDPSGEKIQIEARAQAHWRTGVEMEALVAASATALTIYDMCKAVDRGMTVQNLRLSEKSGGKSGHFVRREDEASTVVAQEKESDHLGS